jgi:hypothetical protein
MNSDDDQSWLDALAGRESADSATTREARALRSALRTEATPRASGTRDAAREELLIARARREGIIATTVRRRFHWQLPLAASVLIFIAGGIVMQLRSPPTAPVTRGDEGGVVRLQDADPAALKQTILTELRAAGASATGYEALDVHGIDADLPLPLTPEMRLVLAAHAIPEPPDGVLRVEIRSSE